MPGLIDANVHINEPGRKDWETFATATKAAAAGGFTTIIDRPTWVDPFPPSPLSVFRSAHTLILQQCHALAAMPRPQQQQCRRWRERWQRHAARSTSMLVSGEDWCPAMGISCCRCSLPASWDCSARSAAVQHPLPMSSPPSMSNSCARHCASSRRQRKPKQL